MRESWLDSLINTNDLRRADLAEGIALAVSEVIHAEANRIRDVREACSKRVRAALAQPNGTRRRDGAERT